MKNYTHIMAMEPKPRDNTIIISGGIIRVILNRHYHLILPKYLLLHICKTLVSIIIILLSALCCNVTLYLESVVVVIVW